MPEDEWQLPYDFDGLAQINRLTGLIGGNIAGGVEVKGSGAIRSYNYVAGTSGWSIDGDGNVEFNDGTFRGAIEASTIDIGGNDATSFHVDIDGNMWSGSGALSTALFSVENDGVVTITDGDGTVKIDPSIFASGAETRGVINFFPGSTGWTAGSVVVSDNGGSTAPFIALDSPTNGTWVDRVALQLFSGDNGATSEAQFVVDLDPGAGTFTGIQAIRNAYCRFYDQILMEQGTAAAPVLSPTTNLDTGFYFPSANSFSFSKNGAQLWLCSDNGHTRGGDGSVSFPAFSFLTDTDSGMYSPGLNSIAFATGGTLAVQIDNNQRIRAVSGAVGTPTYTFSDDTNTGMFNNAADQVSLVAGGSNMLRLDYNGGGANLTFYSEAMRVNTVTGAANVRINTTTGKVAVASSAARFKDEIVRGLTDDLLDRAMRVQPAYWRDIGDSSLHIGFIADDLGLVDKRMISWTEDGLPLGLELDAIVAVLWSEVQRLRELVDAR